ncbi:LOW QUALITY PROTEIN: hamartin-like [Brienomyrus brachyistius]|uniref:LOW QUALITY PROTEIN: hamartin-like n=1 Tax=Brienomyrus brachyistius TaxID=42636 RepID=UPI0020B4083D|nr:LOW QUALITY PROTEIN: hamartin-like [Brienomyrus brachyistius]
MAREQPHIGDLLPLLESSDLRQVEEVKGLIRDHLNADRGAVLVNGLVDYYLEAGSTEAMHILSSVREPHDKHLLDKMNECLASRACRLHTLTLLGHVVRKEPSWIHKIARFPLLLSLLKCLKTDTDVVVLITGVLVLIILLPMIPQPGKQQLYEFFDIFGRLAAWNLKTPGRVTEVYLIHLHASVYSLFHRLYGMYPCNFVSYLRSHYSMKENMDTFEEVVKPMLEHVRIHPELVTGTQDHELDPTRWKRYEIHDIVIECAKVSLDPKEASCEEGYSSAPEHFSAPQPLRHLDSTSSPYADFHSSCGNSYSTPRQAMTSLSGVQPPYRSPQGSRHQIGELNNSCGLKDPFWSPASVCGMTTPPPSRSISPTGIAESTRSSSHFPGRVHGTLGSGKGTPSFSTPVAATPPPTLSDVFSNASRSSGTSSPPRKDNRSLEHLKPGLVRQEPISEQERGQPPGRGQPGRGQPALGRTVWDGSSESVPMTLMELSSFVEEQQSAEQEEDALMQELLKITEDPPQLPSQWGLDSTFCHTTETLTGSQAPGPVALGPSLSHKCHAKSTSTTDRPEGAPDLFTPHRLPHAGQQSPSAPEDEAPSKAALFSPSPCGAATPSYEALFDLALPKAAPHFVRRRTSEALRRVGAEEGEEAGLGPSMGPPMPPSPLEVLDRLIQQGRDAYDKALKRLPLPSKSADWMHFGAGSAPLDELQTLRSQLLLLHNQLLYERYKREQHAVRNRRLLRRIIKATALEEQNSAMKDQLNLQNMDILSLKESLQVEQQRYHQLWEDREAVVTRLHSQIRQLQQGRDEYYSKNQELQSKLLECQKMTGKLEAELQRANNTVCNMGHQLSQLSIKLTTSESMQQQMAFLNKQLLLLGEVNKLCMEELQHSGSDTSKEQQMLLASSDKERERLRLSLVTQAQSLEAAQQRIGELEVQLTKKEHLVMEQKLFLEDVKAQAKGELQASESRYQAQRRVTQTLQTELLQLYSRLEKDSPPTGGGPVPAGGTVQSHSLSVPRMDGDHTSLPGSKVKTAPQDRVDLNSPAATPHKGNISTLLPLPTPGSVNGGGGCPPAWVEPPPPWGSPGAPPPVGSCPTSGSFLDKRAQELLRCKSVGPWDGEPRRMAGLSQGMKTEMCVEPPGPAWGPHTRESRPDVLRANSRDGPISGPGIARQRKQELRIMDYDETHHEHS